MAAVEEVIRERTRHLDELGVLAEHLSHHDREPEHGVALGERARPRDRRSAMRDVEREKCLPGDEAVRDAFHEEERSGIGIGRKLGLARQKNGREYRAVRG